MTIKGDICTPVRKKARTIVEITPQNTTFSNESIDAEEDEDSCKPALFFLRHKTPVRSEVTGGDINPRRTPVIRSEATGNDKRT
ncbi:hypothetical protein KQX54_019740 [Cotesia glomerata]|uniref:Uncharacterized protein n=1 Tax=Cotesia glomerata TaxID=32391 RepID=A0AAV7HUL5_COTGL|nr:hypothetical protein KQX54_019740 [Cotesia glomerata]